MQKAERHDIHGNDGGTLDVLGCSLCLTMDANGHPVHVHSTKTERIVLRCKRHPQKSLVPSHFLLRGTRNMGGTTRVLFRTSLFSINVAELVAAAATSIIIHATA